MILDSVYKLVFEGWTAGDDWQEAIPVVGGTFLPGDAARMQVRSEVDSNLVLLDLTRANGGIQLNTDEIVIIASAAQTVLIPVDSYVFDLRLTRAGLVQTVLFGTLTVRRPVTQP